MKTDLETLKRIAQESMQCYRDSYIEAQIIHNFYHGYHFNNEELAELNENGIPPLYMNLIKKYAHRILAEYSASVNTVKVLPQQQQDVPLAEIMNDLINFDFRSNAIDTDEGQDGQLQALLTGLMTFSCMPVDTGLKDEFGRTIYKNEIKNLDVYDCILDPASRSVDYSDARWFQHQTWMTKEELLYNFPEADLDKLQLGVDTIDTPYNIRRYNNAISNQDICTDLYSVVHACVLNDDSKWESIYYCGDYELDRQDITYRGVKFPYLIYKLHKEDVKNEFYGIFRDGIPRQQAVNYAIINMHRIVNTQKKFVGDGAVKDISKFNKQMGSSGVTGVEVEDPALIVDAISPNEKKDQLNLVLFNIEQFESQIGINAPFLGGGSPDDSGRKILIQSRAASASLQKTGRRLQQAYRNLARMLASYISQYGTAHQAYSIAEPGTVNRMIETNKPLVIIRRDLETGEPILDENGEPILDPVFELVRDPASNEIIMDENGEPLWAPMPTFGSEIRYFDHDIIVDTTSNDNEKETALLFAQQLLNSAAGSILSQAAPDMYMAAWAQMARGMKTSETDKLADLLERAAGNLNIQMQQPQGEQPQ